MNIALIAHDKKKNDMVAFVVAYKNIFAKHTLYATGTTGGRIQEATGLDVHRFHSYHSAVIKKLARILLIMIWIWFFL